MFYSVDCHCALQALLALGPAAFIPLVASAKCINVTQNKEEGVKTYRAGLHVLLNEYCNAHLRPVLCFWRV